MLKFRLRFLPLAILLFLMAGSFSNPLLAKTSKPIVTVDGRKIAVLEIRHRLQRLLQELGEPRWSRRELDRLTKSVAAYLRALSGRQYDKTLAALRRGDRYRPMIRAKLARAGLPLAFEALPMAESAYRFNVRSRTGARGLWQYMPASARHYGLRVGRKVDQRTDPARATDAAVKYLKYLNRKFGDTSILLSVAAYNAGEGRIARVIRKSGVKGGRRGYSHVLRYLPKETRGYVPEFLAAALILKDPAQFGFPVNRQKPHHYIQVRQPLPVRKIASISGVPLVKLQRLNPELKSFRKTPTSNYLVRLPSQAARRLAKNLPRARHWKPVSQPIALGIGSPAKGARKPANRPARTRPGTRLMYQVRRGNHLGGIAKMFGVRLADLRRVNQLKGNRIRVGQRLHIPVKRPLSRKKYRVRAGDNLGRIARRLGVPIRHLQFVNGVTNPRRLQPGQNLYYYQS